MRNSTVEFERVTGAIGAEICNIDLTQTLPEQTTLELRQTLNEHGVIFFRNQKLTPEQYIAFARTFGELTVSKFIPAVPGYPEVAEIRKEADQSDNIGGDWHTDQADRPNPIMGTMLLAHELPKFGGDTLFANLSAVFETLSDGLKRTLEGMRAVHSHDYLMAQSKAKAGDMNIIKVASGGQEAVHPVVMTHPETGRKILYVNPGYTYRFDGWTREESQSLLSYLFQHAQQPEFACRFHWTEGSLAFWDNRQTWHYAVNDYHGQRRLMHRIMVKDRPRQ